MITLYGGLGLIFEADRDVSYAAVEHALHEEAFLDGYLINRTATSDGTRVQISVHTPTTLISADGVPKLDAVQTLRAMANVIEKLDQPK